MLARCPSSRALALTLTDADYKGAVLSRDADVAIGVALAALFTVSAGVGFPATAESRTVMAEQRWGLQGARRRTTASQRAEEQAEEWRIEQEVEARARTQQTATAKGAGEAAAEAASRIVGGPASREGSGEAAIVTSFGSAAPAADVGPLPEE